MGTGDTQVLTHRLEYLGEGGWSTWERGVEVAGRGGLEYLGEGVGVPMGQSMNTHSLV